ncbi:MAG: zinc-binding dehydrogenase [Candidatus Limnocylindrales bacterium]
MTACWAVRRRAGGAFAELAVAARDRRATGCPAGCPTSRRPRLYLTYQTGPRRAAHRARLQPGETLLVTAGAGGVGIGGDPARQGRRRDRASPRAGGPDKVQVCRDLGADHGDRLPGRGPRWPRVKELTGGRGADVVYDPVGGDIFDAARRCVACEGRLVVVGFTSGRIPSAPAEPRCWSRTTASSACTGVSTARTTRRVITAAHARPRAALRRGRDQPAGVLGLPDGGAARGAHRAGLAAHRRQGRAHGRGSVGAMSTSQTVPGDADVAGFAGIADQQRRSDAEQVCRP